MTQVGVNVRHTAYDCPSASEVTQLNMGDVVISTDTKRMARR